MLSKETTDQIRKEAKDRSSNPAHQQGYEWGAEKYAVWKEKALAYEKALRVIANRNVDVPPYVITVATKALEQFK